MNKDEVSKGAFRYLIRQAYMYVQVVDPRLSTPPHKSMCMRLVQHVHNDDGLRSVYMYKYLFVHTEEESLG